MQCIFSQIYLKSCVYFSERKLAAAQKVDNTIQASKALQLGLQTGMVL